MIKFNTLYKDSVAYPCKLSKLFIDICSQVGLEAGNTDFTNCNYMILGNPFTNNEDCRTVLSNIAQLAGGFAKIGRDNKVYIKTLKNISNLLEVRYVNFSTVKELNLTLVKVLSNEKDNADENIDGNNYFDDFSKNEQWGELNSLVIGLSSIEGENTALDDKTSINENGLTEITIQDNYFLTSQEERKKVIVPIWNTLKGIKYLPFKTQYYGYPYLDSGDIIYIQDTKDIGYISYVFNHTFKFNGAFGGTIDTPAMTKTQTTYKNTFDIKTKFRRAERSIDKINGKIKDIVKEVGDRTEKETSVTQDLDGITQSVSEVKTEIKSVDDKADKAQTVADTANTNAKDAKQKADDINNNLTTNYYTKTETNSQITQKAESITSEVSKTYSTKTETSTAKTEAINSANSNTDNKLKDYTETSKLGTAIEQNYEHVKVAWNQISEFIQMMIINNNASLAILDKNKNIMMALDKNGQHFYKEGGKTEFSKMGVNTIDSKNYISFSVPTDYNKSIEDGMAWGVITKSDNKFWPIMYVKNFTMPQKNSGGCTGELVLDGCNLILGAINSGIITGDVKICGDAMPGIFFSDNSTGKMLLSVTPPNIIQDGAVNILDKISFYANAAGSNTLCIGNGANWYDTCVLTDVGTIACGKVTCQTLNETSEEKEKKNFEKFTSKAIDILKTIDIYKYNFKSEKDTDKKHLGFVIGDKYNYSKEVTNNNNTGVNNYAFTSLCCKAIQEQQEQIDDLQLKDKQKDELIQSLIKRIETLKKEVNNGKDNI